MPLKDFISSAWASLKRRTTKSLLIVAITSVALILLLNVIPLFFDSSITGSGMFSAFYVTVSTIATSVLAACIVSVMFDLKSIRDLIVKNDVDVLLGMLLRSDELFSTNGSDGGEHEKILENIRLKSTAALNGINFDPSSYSSESTLDMRRGHVRACLTSLDQELGRAYAKYVNVVRTISRVSDGVFKVDESTYIRYMNDTDAPKKIRAWNYFRSAILPAECDDPMKDVFTERVVVRVNERMPQLYEYSEECTLAEQVGVRSTSRRWKCQWDDDLRNTEVPANGTCVMEIHRKFFIPEKEEISYQWGAVRAECTYRISYEGDDYRPEIHIINCGLCQDSANRDCSNCEGNEDRRIVSSGNTQIAVLRNWPNLGTTIRVNWV